MYTGENVVALVTRSVSKLWPRRIRLRGTRQNADGTLWYVEPCRSSTLPLHRGRAYVVDLTAQVAFTVDASNSVNSNMAMVRDVRRVPAKSVIALTPRT